jgi:hypothetical protein
MFPFIRKTGIYAMVLGMLFLFLYAFGQLMHSDATLGVGKAGFVLMMFAALLFIIDNGIEWFFYPYDD